METRKNRNLTPDRRLYLESASDTDEIRVTNLDGTDKIWLSHTWSRNSLESGRFLSDILGEPLILIHNLMLMLYRTEFVLRFMRRAKL